MNFGDIEKMVPVEPFIDGACRNNEFAVLAKVAPTGVTSRTYYFKGEYRSADAQLSRISDVYTYRDNRGNTRTRAVNANLKEVTAGQVLSTL